MLLSVSRLRNSSLKSAAQVTRGLKKALFITLAVLFADQALKIWIKTNMYLGQEFSVLGNWFIIHFTENNGMAFGMEFGGETGKIALSIFRIIAVSLIGFYLFRTASKGAKTGLIVAGSLIFAGAMGNILDSMFYGILFNDSYHQIAQFMPDEGGYAPFLYGRVVDMLYFPIYEGFLPAWLPIWGGDYFVFFRPVFNIADSAISCGVASVLLFHRGFFSDSAKD